MSQIETEYTRNIVCPYCGYEDRDSWEVDFGGLEGETEMDCRNCGETFLAERHVTVDYSTKKPTLPNDGENKPLTAEEVNP